MQRACKEGFLLELLVVRRDVFAQFNRPVGRLFLPLFFCVVVVDLSFRSIFHAYETLEGSPRPLHSLCCLFFSLFSLFLSSLVLRHAPCAMRRAAMVVRHDDWRLVPHGNGPWQWRHGRPWSMAAPSPFPPPPPVSPVSLFLSFLSCSFCLELEGGSRGNRTHSTVPGLAWWKTISKTGEKRRSMQW